MHVNVLGNSYSLCNARLRKLLHFFGQMAAKHCRIMERCSKSNLAESIWVKVILSVFLHYWCPHSQRFKEIG